MKTKGAAWRILSPVFIVVSLAESDRESGKRNGDLHVVKAVRQLKPLRTALEVRVSSRKAEWLFAVREFETDWK